MRIPFEDLQCAEASGVVKVGVLLFEMVFFSKVHSNVVYSSVASGVHVLSEFHAHEGLKLPRFLVPVVDFSSQFVVERGFHFGWCLVSLEERSGIGKRD